MLGRQLGLLEGVKAGEGNEDWQVGKDGWNIVRAEVRPGDDSVSMMLDA